ncbi:MAG: hypothetical protein Q7J65_07840 [Candidatus Marinimicrobia bacterium]|nr:hypothetical protein [Candidatus Neomarinimicrobiota bacterium]
MIAFSGNNWSELFNIAALVLLPVFLYAEMHYRLPLLKGFLYKKQPEILFDLPCRTETGIIPVLLLIKDAHWFPVTIDRLLVRLIAQDGHSIYREIPVPLKKQVTQKWFHIIIDIDVSEYKNQWLGVDCFAYVTYGKKSTVIHNDNYRTLSQRPFNIFIDSDPIPLEKGWLWGDMHSHSSFTEDQVEFGAPPECYRIMARAMGISFYALTEHSYDMDDTEDSWTENDPQLRKWAKFRQSIQELNANDPDFLIIPGEEVSVDNGFGRTVHMGILNNPNFHIGTGDGMEHSLGKETENHYAKVLDSIPENTLAFAAHPFDNPSLLHRLLIRRGVWNRWDSHPRLDGLQILNGNPTADFEWGKKFWISQLLKGRRQLIYAGNDSHGNFNRFRQIVLPLLFMREHRHQIFGYNLTGVKSDLAKGMNGIIKDLKKASVIISNGPFICLSMDSARILTITAKTSTFFGSLKTISVYLGDPAKQKEFNFHTKKFQNGQTDHTIHLATDDIPDQGYFRAELSTHKDRFAMTNAVWFEVHPKVI